MLQKCKTEDPSLKSVFKTSLNRSENKEKNDQCAGSKRGKITKLPIDVKYSYFIKI